MRLVFHVSPTSIDWIYTNKTCDALANLQWSIHKNHIEKLDLPWFSYGYQKCMFIDSLTKHKGPYNAITIERGIVNKL